MENHPTPEAATATPATASRRVIVVGAVLLFLGGLLSTSLAVYTGLTGTSGSTLEVGVLDVEAPVQVPLEATALGPGDVVAAGLEVRNDGSLELRYALTSTVTTAPLADALALEVRVGVTSCTSTAAAADGTLLAGPVRLGGVTGDDVFGSPAPGPHAGDRVLAAGTSEVLCLRLSMPDDVSPSVAGLTTAATLTLFAEQVAANP